MNLKTVSQIADEGKVNRTRIIHVLKTRKAIRPKAVVAGVRLYGPEQIAAILRELKNPLPPGRKPGPAWRSTSR